MSSKKNNRALQTSAFVGTFWYSFWLVAGTNNYEHILLCVLSLKNVWENFCVFHQLFSIDDSEHEWIVQTCRKAWDEVGDPEKSVALRNKDSNNIDWKRQVLKCTYFNLAFRTKLKLIWMKSLALFFDLVLNEWKRNYRIYRSIYFWCNCLFSFDHYCFTLKK